ncbi:HCL284Wp [Eremothecium sinecaudum]|uniref:HCL284Wp n=1 Tax=Eremothecium sinecaudum TaxID=45286 RepID=A0A109UZ75_9SACH|nr:HCL284Wp [Eremothecium sinecaudum]AMD19867.1 HCL284Wp [Eremothecium sinecaudum]
MVLGLNLSGTLNSFKLLLNPRLCLPDVSVSTFNDLPIPLDKNIKAVVLDKDNCFASPHELNIWPDYINKWEELRKAYPEDQLLIVSNTAGTGDDIGFKQAAKLELNTKVSVFRHDVKKPGCGEEILEYFYKRKIINSPNQVAIVGDRLFTDIMMANMIGARGFWIKDGVKPTSNPLVHFERKLYELLKHEN